MNVIRGKWYVLEFPPTEQKGFIVRNDFDSEQDAEAYCANRKPDWSSWDFNIRYHPTVAECVARRQQEFPTQEIANKRQSVWAWMQSGDLAAISAFVQHLNREIERLTPIWQEYYESDIERT